MDDKLYYVESPDGQVLGPMTMMNVLEGIAAGAVLEDARVCEVGQAGWISLADLAYARAESAPAPTAQPAATSKPRAGSSVRKLSDDFLVEERWTAPPPKQTTPEGVAQRARERLARESAPAKPPARPPEPVYEEPVPSASETEEVQQWADATRELAGDGHEPAAESYAEPVYAGSAYSESERPRSGDFSLSMAEADVESMARHSRSARRGPPVTLIAAGGCVAVLAGLWFLFGERILGPRKSTEPQAKIAAGAPVDVVEDAWKALGSGDTATALASFRRAVEDQPENVRAHHGLGLAALQTGDLELASAHLERATTLAPDDIRMRLDLGNARLRQGRWELAVQEAEKAQTLAPDNPAPLLLLGRAHATGGRQDEAIKVLSSFVERAPKHEEARKDLAHALAAAGRVAPAIDEMNKYLDAQPDDREAQKTRLEWMISVGSQAAAGRIYVEAAAKQPNDAFAQYLAGLACTGTEDGVTHLRRATELAPSDREAWASLARAQAAIGRHGLAVDAMTKAIALAPATPAEEKRIAAWRAATPPAAPPVVQGPTPTLADRAGKIRRALGRGDFRTAHRALDAARSELTGREAARNLALWAAIIDFEEGYLREAQKEFAALDADASYVGFSAGAVTNWLARTHLSLGDSRGAIGVLDAIGPEHPDEYATSRLWEGIALASLGMAEIAQRTWLRLGEDVGSSVGKSGRAAVKSAEFLAGAIAEKEYRNAVSPVDEFENDMHFVLGWATRSADRDAARAHFRESLETSHGREFPYQLAQAELDGRGLGRK